MQAPTLTDSQDPDRITLRPHQPQDVDDVYVMGQDPQLQRWTTVPVPFRREHAVEFVSQQAAAASAHDGTWQLAIEADDDGRPRYAGSLGLRPTGPGSAELSFGLAPWARGRGVMSRSVRLLLAWALHPAEDGLTGAAGAGLTVVQWRAHVGNWASRRVAWSCGFQVEGTVRGLCTQRGRQLDGWIGSIVAGDPLSPRTTWLEVPELTGDQVRLRAWRPQDAPAVVEACADPRTQHWLVNLPSPYTVADAQWYIGSRQDSHATGDGLYWCVADLDDDRCLGAISLMHLSAPTAIAEMGYWAHPAARGRGVMSQSARLVLNYALTGTADGGLGLPRVCLRAGSDNLASRRVAQQAGLRECGVERSAERLRDGSRADLVLHDAVPSDLV